MKKSFVFLLLLTCSQFYAQSIRNWATYYGADGGENVNSVATDASGNIYLAGSTTSTTGIASGGFQNTFGGAMDAFLVKFDPVGNRLWATYYGDSGPETVYGIAVDISGNVYIAGETNSSSGIASGGFQNSPGGGGDAYLVKFDANGNRLWATYYGGGGQEIAHAIATDPNGNVYLVGTTLSASGIASGGFQNTFGGGSTDAFAVKFDSTGARIWATYYGGADNDHGIAIAIDAQTNIYISGNTASTSNIASAGFQNSYAGGNSDAFVVKLDSAGNRDWATYYGGTGDDDGICIQVDSPGNVYLAGSTGSTSGIASGGFQNALVGSENAFLVKLDSTGNRLWGTYYGGTGIDRGYALCTDYLGNVYLAGGAESDSVLASGGHQDTLGGESDAFLVAFSGSGNRLCATYFGGAGHEFGQGVIVDTSGYVYLAGIAESTAGIASWGFQNTHGGGLFDGFLVQFIACPFVAVEEQEMSFTFSLFPNPSAGTITVEGQGELRVYNMLGEIILTQTLLPGQTEIDLNEQPAGIYFFELRSGEKRMTRKLIIE